MQVRELAEAGTLHRMTGEAVRTGLSEAEYLVFERSSDAKHEYLRGEMFTMAGAKRRHNLIVGNVVGELRDALRDRPCEVYPSDMRVKIEATGLYTYPDASAVCADPQFQDDAEDTLLNPEAIFEILSDSTEAYDRGKKFEHYRGIPALRDYVLVSQSERLVEHFVRQPDGTWNLRVVREGTLLRESLDVGIEIDELYLKVFEEP